MHNTQGSCKDSLGYAHVVEGDPCGDVHLQAHQLHLGSVPLEGDCHLFVSSVPGAPRQQRGAQSQPSQFAAEPSVAVSKRD